MGQFKSIFKVISVKQQDEMSLTTLPLIDNIEMLIGKKSVNFLQNIIQNYSDINNNNKFLQINKLNLPKEIVIKILSYLSLNDLIKLIGVNKSFKNYWATHFYLWKEQLLKLKLINYNTICCCCFDKNDYKIDLFNYYYKPTIMFNNFFTKIDNNIVNELTTQQWINKTAIIYGEKYIGKSTWLYKIINGVYNDTIYKGIYLKDNLYLKNQNNLPFNFNLNLNITIYYNRLFSFEYLKNNVDVIFCCFSLTNKESFKKVYEILKEIAKSVNEDKSDNSLIDLNSKIKGKKVICIVGLQNDCYTCDDNRYRKVSVEEINELLSQLVPCTREDSVITFNDLNIQYFEVSSKMNCNVDIPFYFAAYKLIKIEELKIKNNNLL